MSAVLDKAPPATRTEDQRRSWAAVFALARFEARKLLLRLPVLFMFVLHAAWICWDMRDAWTGYPALQDVDRATQTGPMLPALAVLLCANQAVLRSQRQDTDRHFGVLVLEPWRRTVAFALSVVPAVVLTALLVGAQFTWGVLAPGSVGHGSVGELLVGPLTVLLAGTAGVLLARVVRSPFAAPMLLVLAFFAITFLGAVPGDSDGSATRWLVPVIGDASSKPLPSDLLGRPAAWHALYLFALALTLALAAVLVNGGRTKTVAAALVVAVGLGTWGAVGQAGKVSDATTQARVLATVNPAKVQSCVREGSSTYCAFPEWTPRIGTWAKVTDGVQSLAGGTAAQEKLLVRQRVEARYGMDSDGSIVEPSTVPYQVTVGTRWGGPRVPEFAAAVSSVLVMGSEKAVGSLCDGRMVTIMWLALGWQSDPVTQLRAVRLDDSASGSAIVVSPTNPMSMTAEQTTVLTELFAAGPTTITPKVKAHWSELTAPKVTTAKVAQLLGVKAPTGADKCE
ncbi:ABC transporter permease [Streptomyces sp. MBT65]|uniref:ABC transporter permease n=1 Tax=Streptomyces sp. MBT65 TaxID=1488395 RepID=UPI0019091B46|nr:ABC transporter permease [Streptomyces sp. MBT65]MBK3580609.1 ABC transporter permease [Streptomyces sp. MBT65]